jgi:hypothetical protein
MKDSPINQLRDGKLHEMVRWYDPRLLARVGIRTMVSSVFGQYADQRLVQAATDPADVPELKVRYDYSQAAPSDPTKRLPMDSSGAYWVDYIADTADGFESTYTMAYLLSQDKVTVNEDGKNSRDLQAGSILIMGGDQCYPQATREDYKRKLVTPFNWAYDTPEATRKLFAIPGNHDWYDGLAAFDSLFCSSRDRLSEAKGTKMGGWQCQQHRSYWAMRLPYDWWIWGTDVQFSKYLDGAQVSYFEMMAAQMKPGDKLIICMAEPSWMLSDFQGQDEEENFYKITSIARQAGVRICAVVAGDWHHYARYYMPDHDVHFITAGGGGSFLHPTHVLKDNIKVEWPEQIENATQPMTSDAMGPPAPAGWVKQKTDIRLGVKAPAQNTPMSDAVKVAKQVGDVIEEAVKPLEGALRQKKARPRILKRTAPKVYPEKSVSRLLSLKNLLFPFYNVPFAIGVGLIYWFITWQFYSIVELHDISAGKIDSVGVHTSFTDVFSFLPLYMIQAMLVSIPLVAMMGVLWVLLMSYVDAGERDGFRRLFRKGIVGSLHFIAHLVVMFGLGIYFVMVNNWIAPRVEPFVNSLWASSSAQTGSGRVVREVFEPLSQSRQSQREMFEDRDSTSQGRRRAAPPASALPDAGKAVAPANDKLLTKGVRQVVGFILYPLEMILIGGFFGGFVWGLYWTLTSVFLRMHAEDAFAALRIKHYKNFLRFKFEKDKLTIYPIGVDRVPNKNFWTDRPKGVTPPLHNPVLVAKKPIVVRLIEAPIVISSDDAEAWS